MPVYSTNYEVETQIIIERLQQIDQNERKLGSLLVTSHGSYRPPQPHHEKIDPPKQSYESYYTI